MRISISNNTSSHISCDVATIPPAGKLIVFVEDDKLDNVLSELQKLGTSITYRLLDQVASVRSITEPLTLYVTTSGSDSNSGTVRDPFLTIQAALDSLKDVEIAAAVTIQVGEGTFDGFVWPRFIVRDFSAITLQGTMVQSAVSTGTATGTATSGSSATINDTGQSWTVNDLKGKWVSFPTAPTSYNVIVSNTATSAIFISSTTPTAGLAYTISQPGTIVKGTANYTTPSVKTCCSLTDTNGNTASTNIIRNIKFTTEYGGTYCVGASPRANMTFSTCEFHVSSLGTSGVAIASPLAGGSGLLISTSRCYFNLEMASSTGYAALGTFTPQVSYFRGGNKTQTGIHASGWLSVYGTSACVFETLKYAHGVSLSYTSNFDARGSNLMGTFIDCDTVCYINGKMSITDSKSNYPSFPLSSSGNTTFILIDRLAHIQVSSNVPSGLATTDISVNGVTSTLAAMRALTPKVFPATPNVYGSYVYE